MGIIRELPQSLINQIAAGEVVERPASVLKELIENSLDATATRISVVVETSGNGLIHVKDNGTGILREDLPKATLRHATSKIASYEDLVSAKTLGFRGEALASISSVSRITIESRHSSEQVGTRMVIDPGSGEEMTDWHGPVGTSIMVRDLFFNVPVRRKFLKSPQTEMGHLVETLSRISMGFHECQFDMSSPTRKILSLTSRTSPFLRLLDLYPSLSEEDLVFHEIQGDELSIQVYLLRPDKVRKDRQYQQLFINRRWIRHPGLFEAITQGASGKVSRDVHVGAWVYLDLDPEKLDVNVHPTKREVRFLEGDRLFSFVRRAVEESFSLFDARVQSVSADPLISRPIEHKNEIIRGAGDYSPPISKPLESFQEKGSVFSEFSSISEEIRPGGKVQDLSKRKNSLPDSLAFLPEMLKSLPFEKNHPGTEDLAMLGQIAGTYLIFSWGGDLAIVDLHTAHERINYEKYRYQIEKEGVSVVSLLFPIIYKVSLSIADNLDNRLEELSRIGLNLDRTGPDAFRIRSVPFILEGEDPIEVLNGLKESSLDFELPILRSDRIDEVLMTVSCHRSVRKNDHLDPMDGERLIRELLETPHPYTCPHGRPTMIRLTRRDLNQWFGR